jgi:hypothetical protein
MPDSTPETRMPLRSKGLLDNVVSPCGLALISYAFFLFACLIPPSVHSHYMMEPDLMFLDPATILFCTPLDHTAQANNMKGPDKLHR